MPKARSGFFNGGVRVRNAVLIVIAAAACWLAASCDKQLGPEPPLPAGTITPTASAAGTAASTATLTHTATMTMTATLYATSTPVVYRFETGISGWSLNTPGSFPQSAGFVDYWTNTEPAYILSGAGSLGINCALGATAMGRRGDFSIDLAASPAVMCGKSMTVKIFVTPELAALASNPYQIFYFTVDAASQIVTFGTAVSLTTTGWNTIALPVEACNPVKMAGIRIKSFDGANALSYDGAVFIDEIGW